MCEPTLIISALAQGAGISMQNASKRESDAYRALLMRQNAERNRALEDTQRAAIQDATAVASSDAGLSGMDNAASALATVLKGAIRAGNNKPLTSRRGPKIIEDEQAVANAKAIQAAQKRASAIAQLDGINAYLNNTVQPKVADAAAEGGLVGNFMRGNSNVLNTGLEYASSKAVNPLAQLLIGAGQTGMAYGLYDGKDKVIPTED